MTEKVEQVKKYLEARRDRGITSTKIGTLMRDLGITNPAEAQRLAIAAGGYIEPPPPTPGRIMGQIIFK